MVWRLRPQSFFEHKPMAWPTAGTSLFYAIASGIRAIILTTTFKEASEAVKIHFSMKPPSFQSGVTK